MCCLVKCDTAAPNSTTYDAPVTRKRVRIVPNTEDQRELLV